MEKGAVHNRRSIRLQNYDYTKEGAYYITICTSDKRLLFGTVNHESLLLNRLGQIAEQCWLEIPDHSTKVTIDYYILMPNHFHGILFIAEPPTDSNVLIHSNTVRALHVGDSDFNGTAPCADGVRVPYVIPRSLGSIVRSYKSAVSRLAHGLPEFKTTPIWQRNYYEHVIRDEDDLYVKRNYILNNPLQWELDEFYCT